MKCPKCGSENVSVQVVTEQRTKHKGCLYWAFIGWWLECLLWLFLTLPRLLIAIFAPKRTKSVQRTVCVCQSCGNRWNK
jgi:DNA-directed RNA polymerase subunit M/transcription elongation factor TFIIS